MSTSPKRIQLEICIDSVESALAAQKGGADRIELCANLTEGGTTPSAGMIKACRQIEGLELYVMIRPRGGDFFYSNHEFEIMQEDIRVAKQLGADGVVLGLLLPSGEVDVERTKTLIQLASPMKVTFHRAFDMCRNPLKALEQLVEVGTYRILTSGQRQSAWEGKELIGQLVDQAENRIKILAGAGINPENVKELIKATGLKECHFSAKTCISSSMTYRNPNITMGGSSDASEYDLYRSDLHIIKRIRSIVNKI